MTTTTSDAEIFGRVFEPEKIGMSREAARAIAMLDFDAADRRRMNVLAEKARRGTLSKKEDEELESFIRVGHLLSIMQSKARKVLKNRAKDQ